MPEGVEIETLLADRQRLQDWIGRLEAASGSAPEPVRQRVRGDYEGRLAEVVARLRGFTTTLSASLQNVRSQREHLDGLKAEAEEAEAEAMLRHDVGEYTDEQWEAIARDSRARIEGLSGDIARLSDEAARLEEVLAQVMPREPRAERRPGRGAEPPSHDDRLEVQVIEPEDVPIHSQASPGPDDTASDDDEEGAPVLRERSTPIEAPRFTPKPGAEPRPRATRTLRFPMTPPGEGMGAPSVDEMTFLKSVAFEGQATERGTSEGAGRTAKAGPTAAKTLKCTECGAMNRPTEWYCERCGAELAAL
jgi:hypothetical protein